MMDSSESRSIRDANPIKIRVAVTFDLPFLPAIEESAAKVFESIPDLSFIAADSPLSIDVHRSYLSSNHLWVATSSDVPVAFLAAKCINSAPHEKEERNNLMNSKRHLYIVECSVHSSYQRRGIASQLFAFVEAYAREQGFGCVTLVTFLDISWNGRFYQKLGFEEIEAQTMGDAYVGILAEEIGQWKQWKPDRWRRGVMVRKLL
jgi:ribosomal protein S18 acetylase RimI-like enzyme